MQYTDQINKNTMFQVKCIKELCMTTKTVVHRLGQIYYCNPAYFYTIFTYIYILIAHLFHLVEIIRMIGLH